MSNGGVGAKGRGLLFQQLNLDWHPPGMSLGSIYFARARLSFLAGKLLISAHEKYNFLQDFR